MKILSSTVFQCYSARTCKKGYLSKFLPISTYPSIACLFIYYISSFNSIKSHARLTTKNNYRFLFTGFYLPHSFSVVLTSYYSSGIRKVDGFGQAL